MLGRIAATGSAHSVHLIYGVTNDEDLVGIEQLTKFAERIPNFTFSCPTFPPLRFRRHEDRGIPRVCDVPIELWC
jgi:benzoate/toluate 1,2-dioxygenase reductase subunit